MDRISGVRNPGDVRVGLLSWNPIMLQVEFFVFCENNLQCGAYPSNVLSVFCLFYFVLGRLIILSI